MTARSNPVTPAPFSGGSDDGPADAPLPGLNVLTLNGDRIAGVTRFPDNSLLPRFGLPRTLPGYQPRHARTLEDE